MMTMYLFGDSIGRGIVLNAESGRYETVDFLKPLRKNHGIVLKNYSMFGCTMIKGLSLIERHSQKFRKDDVVVVEYGGNDCNFSWKEIAGAPEKEHNPKTSPEDFIHSYQLAVEGIRMAGAKPVVLTLPPLDAGRFLNWVAAGISKDNILKWLGGADMIYRWQEMYSLAVSKLAKMHDIPLIDIRSEFLCRKDISELLCIDGMHPTRKGYDLIMKTASAQLTEWQRLSAQMKIPLPE